MKEVSDFVNLRKEKVDYLFLMMKEERDKIVVYLSQNSHKSNLLNVTMKLNFHLHPDRGTISSDSCMKVKRRPRRASELLYFFFCVTGVIIREVKLLLPDGFLCYNYYTNINIYMYVYIIYV